ncbi:DUF7287 family protein [Haloarcula laminariae]|uniref:DUF7287 family protein n=1 Tax=Haloarcula laminariae TaxID=2961577 RepID=UPI0021C722AC|nr:hypothetical protein [Halomicroarcula laminariae]
MTGERGQTTQDFAIGVSVLLVTVIGAFVFTQTGALAVYEGTSPGVKQPQADRIASYVVENYSTDEGQNVLRYDEDGGIEELSGNMTRLKLRAGTNVSSDRRTDPIVNVSIVNGTTLEEGARDPATDLIDSGSWGEYRRSSPVTTSRVVRIRNYDCGPVCWVVVRVW